MTDAFNQVEHGLTKQLERPYRKINFTYIADDLRRDKRIKQNTCEKYIDSQLIAYPVSGFSLSSPVLKSLQS